MGSDCLDQAEVRNLHVAAVADQDVLWLEVAVDDGGLELMQALRTRENAATGEEQTVRSEACVNRKYATTAKVYHIND